MFQHIPNKEDLSNIKNSFITSVRADNFFNNREKFTKAIIINSTGLHEPGGYNDVDLTQEYNYYSFNTSDNAERLNIMINLPHTKQELVSNRFIDESANLVEIQYRINKLGLRCEQLTNESGILFIGCSFTYGTGINEELSWPQLVCNYFKQKCWNFGMPSFGLNIPTFYFLNWFSEDYVPTAVVVFEPPLTRIEILTQQQGTFNIKLMSNIIKEDLRDVNSFRFTNGLPLTSALHYKNSLRSLELYAKNKGIPFLKLGLADLHLKEADVDLARDLMHFGQNVHRIASQVVVEKLTTLGLKTKSDK
jgi:hypothetical protein